jgi:predicted nucleic acid-binding protein
MKTETLILDASPIILLGKAGLLSTISPLAESWLIPESVVTEVEDKRSIDDFCRDLEKGSRVKRVVVAEIHPVVAAWDLGQGESAVLSLAAQKPNASVVLDDLQARKCADLLEIPKVGSLGLILSTRRNGYVEAARPEIEKLRDAGLHIDPDMVDRVLQKIGE